jgi:hypothetical protein
MDTGTRNKYRKNNGSNYRAPYAPKDPRIVVHAYSTIRNRDPQAGGCAGVVWLGTQDLL